MRIVQTFPRTSKRKEIFENPDPFTLALLAANLKKNPSYLSSKMMISRPLIGRVLKVS